MVAVGFTGGLAPRIHPGLVRALHPMEGANVIETSTEFDHGVIGQALNKALNLRKLVHVVHGTKHGAGIQW